MAKPERLIFGFQAGGGWRWDAFEGQGWVATIGTHLAAAASPSLLRAGWHKLP